MLRRFRLKSWTNDVRGGKAYIETRPDRQPIMVFNDGAVSASVGVSNEFTLAKCLERVETGQWEELLEHRFSSMATTQAAVHPGGVVVKMPDIHKIYRQGFIDGLTAYAHWHNGSQVVGTSYIPLKKAVAKAENTWNYCPPHQGADDA